MKAFISWSGGKETMLSCYKVMKDKDIEVAGLLNMVSEDGIYSRSHGIRSNILRSQAEAIGIPILQKKATWNTYEEEFKIAVAELKNQGVVAGVFGDIDFQPHRDWVEKICKETQIKAIMPLWGETREKVLSDFITAGFETVIVATQSDKLGSDWLGRKIDKEFIKDLKELGGVDLCGEAGEYHTFVTSGPIFKKRVTLTKTNKINRDKHWFLDILKYELSQTN